MPSPTAPNPKERRRTPRTQCRLHGRVSRGRERIRVRIVDISEGGLCLLSPLWLDPKKPVQIAIDVPGRGISTVGVEIWHIRREKSRSSANKVWIAGAILIDSDATYLQLLEAAGLAVAFESSSTPPAQAEKPVPAAKATGGVKPKPVKSAPDTAIDSVDPRVFRLRCKAKGSPRTRLLTIAAESEAEALELAHRDLGADWSVLEALEA
jgi:hypothetical protein